MVGKVKRTPPIKIDASQTNSDELKTNTQSTARRHSSKLCSTRVNSAKSVREANFDSDH